MENTTKILALTLSIFLTSSLSFAEEVTLPPHLTWEKVEEKCATFSESKRKNHKICKAAEKRKRQEEKLEAFPFLSLRMFSDLSFVNMQGKDKNSGAGFNLNSEYGLKTSFMLVQHYNNGFKTYQGLGFEHIEFENSLLKPLVDRQMNLWDVSLGFVFNPWRTGSLDMKLVYGESYYLRSYSATQLKLDKYFVPGLQVRFNQDLFSVGQTDLGLGLKGGVLKDFEARNRQEPLANYDVQVNYNYGLEVYARKQWSSWSIMGGISYDVVKKDTSILEAENRETTVNLRFAIPLGFNEGDE